MKTYACKVKDYYGVVYTVGYFLSSSPAEALERAVRDCGVNAWAEEVSSDGEIIRTVDDLIHAENDYTAQRMAGGR